MAPTSLLIPSQRINNIKLVGKQQQQQKYRQTFSVVWICSITFYCLSLSLFITGTMHIKKNISVNMPELAKRQYFICSP